MTNRSSIASSRSTANTFEATFEYDLLDPDGKVLKHDFATATSGSGTRGTFDFRVPFEAPSGVGRLVVYERSAADGSKTHVVEIPITFVDRTAGRSKMSRAIVLEAVWKVPWLRLTALTGRL